MIKIKVKENKKLLMVRMKEKLKKIKLITYQKIVGVVRLQLMVMIRMITNRLQIAVMVRLMTIRINQILIILKP